MTEIEIRRRLHAINLSSKPERDFLIYCLEFLLRLSENKTQNGNLGFNSFDLKKAKEIHRYIQGGYVQIYHFSELARILKKYARQLVNMTVPQMLADVPQIVYTSQLKYDPFNPVRKQFVVKTQAGDFLLVLAKQTESDLYYVSSEGKTLRFVRDQGP